METYLSFHRTPIKLIVNNPCQRQDCPCEALVLERIIQKLASSDRMFGGRRHPLIEIEISFTIDDPQKVLHAKILDTEWTPKAKALAETIHSLVSPIVTPLIERARKADAMLNDPFHGTTFRYSSVYQAQFPDCGVSDGKQLIGV